MKRFETGSGNYPINEFVTFLVPTRLGQALYKITTKGSNNHEDNKKPNL
jgi:hypothetical protein